MSARHKWERGYMGRYWDKKDYNRFDYKRQPITEEEVQRWKNMGYDYVKNFTGVCYDNSNPMPLWLDRIRRRFWKYKDLTFTFYKMSTLEIMPAHSDHYRTYCKLHNTQPDDVVRILLMLEDWKPGHYLEINGTGIINWVAGEFFIWEGDCPHAAANIGVEDRYTLQITGTKVHWEDIWESVHWYNIPDLPTKAESYDSYLKNQVLRKIPEYEEQPMMVYLYNGEIKHIHNIKHEEHVVEMLNEKGLDFYLYEPLCSYIDGCPDEYTDGGTKHSAMFYSEFTGEENPRDFRADELDSILNYAKNNNLKNVRVHTCDYQVEKYYPYYTKQGLQLYEDDLFLLSAEPIKLYDWSLSYEFDTKFISLNWRYTLHRHLIAAYLARVESRILTWFFKSDIYHLHGSPWINLMGLSRNNKGMFSKLLDGLLTLNNNTPYTIDIPVKEAVAHNHFYHKELLPDHKTIFDAKKNLTTEKIEKVYRNVFCDIVTESRFAQPTANYSEKAYRAMFYRKPFIMVAPPKTLEYMKSHGFQTFSDFWDESYDDEYDHEKRLYKIFELIDYINNKSIQELNEMFYKMMPIVQHNFELTNKIINPSK